MLRVKFKSQTRSAGSYAFETARGRAADLFKHLTRMMKPHGAVEIHRNDVQQFMSDLESGHESAHEVSPFTQHYM